jgi:5-methylcytosine-specific restriction endonuclease McrA
VAQLIRLLQGKSLKEFERKNGYVQYGKTEFTGCNLKTTKRRGQYNSTDTEWVDLTLTPDGVTKQKTTPVRMRVRTVSTSTSEIKNETSFKAKQYWAFQGRVYETSDHDLTAKDVMALANEASNVRRLRLEKAHALQAMTRQLDEKAKRRVIPQDVKVAVWQRDGGRCAECASNKALEFDHIIPLAMGGANTMRNLQLLCADCNRRKGATLG